MGISPTNVLCASLLGDHAEGGQRVSDRQDAFREKVEGDRRKRATLYFNYPGPWEFLFSEAGRAITKTHPSAIVVYLHVIARQTLPPKKRERMRLEKLGLWPPKNPKEFSFPIEEGPIHGLGKSATASGLFILHDVGAIDRLHPGSATRGEFATYVLSDRWRQWRPPSGGPDFVVLEWKKAQVIGTRDATIMDENGIIVHKGTGKFLKRGRSPKTSRKVRVVASRTTSKPPLVAMDTTREKQLVAMTAMNKAPDADPLVAMSTIFLSEPYLDSDHGVVKKVKKKTRPLGHGSKGIAAATNAATSSPKPWRPPLSEIKENVAEILRQRPDPRADDPRFVRFLADQLLDAQRGKLNPSRVHHDLQDRHDLDDWTADLMFTVATIDLQFRGAMN